MVGAGIYELLPLGVPGSRLLESLGYLAGDRQVLAVVRGDHAVNEMMSQP